MHGVWWKRDPRLKNCLQVLPTICSFWGYLMHIKILKASRSKEIFLLLLNPLITVFVDSTNSFISLLSSIY